MQDFRNLNVWEAARRLTKEIYQSTADYPTAKNSVSKHRCDAPLFQCVRTTPRVADAEVIGNSDVSSTSRWDPRVSWNAS